MSARTAKDTILLIFAMPFIGIFKMIEAFLFVQLNLYEHYLYYPLQKLLWPFISILPRDVTVNKKTYTVFTANIVTYVRTFLVIPIAYTLKYNYYWTGAWLVVLHDFLDHVDGIVAKVHKQKYGQVDDPTLGGFLDAFCDKIVNGTTLWTVLVVTNFSHMNWFESFVYAFSCGIIIAYEFVLGVVRVQDYFKAHYLKKFNQIDENSNKVNIAASMEGKLKEKLESIGMAALCVSQATPKPLLCVSGIIGVTCLLLSIRLAHSSLMHKISARFAQTRSLAHASDDEDAQKVLNDSSHGEKIRNGSHNGKILVNNWTQEDFDCSNCEKKNRLKQNSNTMDTYEMEKTYRSPDSNTLLEKVEEEDGEEKGDSETNPVSNMHRCFSMPGTEIYRDAALDARAERVYTIGCFDLFHHGHVTLLKRMRTFGKKLVVGIHDSRSIYQLKNRVPIDSTITRMRNVKQFADEVFCVAGTDPTPFIDAIFDRENTGSAIYVRGDDMTNFPARNLCEKLMTVKFLPYTAGVSSTKIRKNLFNSSHYDFRVDDSEILFY